MEYLKRFALWFVSGLGIAAGVALVVAGLGDSRQMRPEIATSNVPLEQVSLANIQISPVTKFLTIVGTITNNTGRELETVRVRVELIDGQKVLFQCSNFVGSLPGPGKTGHLQIECREIEGSLIPEGVTQRVRVWYVETR